ncbi:MAG: LysE family transporter [Zoogloeaceae bacterium]|jgi:homoserine/homoserine lactone efflux protein|nr:LysE family transporter [Zoogloeaceae bacterium]
MEFHLWLTFCFANLLTSISPGPGALAAMNAGLAQGARGGWRMVFGLQLALLLQLLVVALGVGALLVSSGRAFLALRWGGAAYLIWLGLAQLRAVSTQGREASPTGKHEWPVEGMVWRGVWVNLSNPKAILFQVALVPHFIDMASPLARQYLVIAVSMCLIDTFIMGAYAALAARLAPWFESEGLARGRNLLFGVLFVGFGVALLGWRN